MEIKLQHQGVEIQHPRGNLNITRENCTAASARGTSTSRGKTAIKIEHQCLNSLCVIHFTDTVGSVILLTFFFYSLDSSSMFDTLFFFHSPNHYYRWIRKIGSTKEKFIVVRVIAATNWDLRQLIQKGMFREDFFYRSDVLKMYIPPLRERREDIPKIIDYILKSTHPIKVVNSTPLIMKL